MEDVAAMRNLTTKSGKFEFLLYISFFIVFFIMIVSQMALLSPVLREVVAWQDDMEGTPLGKEEYLFKRAVLVLTLDGKEADSEIEVLVNGDTKADFKNGSAQLEVTEGDIIEVDGSSSSGEFSGTVKVISGNLEAGALDYAFQTEKCVKSLGRIVIYHSVDDT